MAMKAYDLPLSPDERAVISRHREHALTAEQQNSQKSVLQLELRAGPPGLSRGARYGYLEEDRHAGDAHEDLRDEAAS